MRHIKIDAAVAGLGEHGGKPLGLKIIERVVWFITAGQMAHDAADPDRVGGDRPGKRGQHVRVLLRADSVAVQTGVDLDRHLRGAAGPGDSGQQIIQLPQCGDSDSHIRVQGRVKGRARGVQPGQHRGGDPVGAQCQRFGDGRDAEFGHPGRQCGAGHGGGAVPVTVGLHHRHHLGRAGVLTKDGDVVRDGTKVDDGFAVDRLGL